MDDRSKPRVLHLATTDISVRFLLFNQLQMLQRAGYDVTAMSAPGPHVEDIARAGIRFLPWRHATRRWDPAADGRAFAELVRTLRAERFDIVHTHNPKPGVLGRIAARATGARAVVNTVHGLYATEGDPSLARRALLGAEWLAARFSHHELYQSAEDLQRSRRLRIAGAASSFLGNGIDLSRFDPARIDPGRAAAVRARYGIAPDVPVIAMVGRLVREKGWLDLFAAMRAVRASHPDAVLLAIGPHDEDKADALTPDDLAGDGIVVTGMLDEIPEALAAADVFVLASYREGFPRSAIEAAAMGLPLILTDIRGCREVVREGSNGLLVPPHRPDALAAAIRRLLDDPAERARMGAAGRDRARREFDERLIVQRTLAVYDRLLRTGRTLRLPDTTNGSRAAVRVNGRRA